MHVNPKPINTIMFCVDSPRYCFIEQLADVVAARPGSIE